MIIVVSCYIKHCVKCYVWDTVNLCTHVTMKDKVMVDEVSHDAFQYILKNSCTLDISW